MALSEIKVLQFQEGIEVETPSENTPLSPGVSTFTLANNQSSAANVTGLSFDETTKRSGRIEYQIRTEDDTPLEKLELGEFFVYYNTDDGQWYGEYGQKNFSDSGVTLSITAGGQVQYTSPNLTGGNESLKLKYRVTTFQV